MATMKAIPLARKAEKRQVKLKLGIQGPSGSGKTWGALALAKNLWPEAKVLVVDTENESASLYADNFEFDTIPLDPPFESVRYQECIDFAVKNGYDVLILDSVTHQWDGDGGILRRKEELDRRPGANSWANWATFTPEHTQFVEAIKQAPIHILATMRTKQDYVLEQNDKGKSKPVKMGMAPIQRDGFDYEFTIVFDVQMDHKATVSKNRTGLFEGKVVNIADKKIAKELKDWLEAGKAITYTPPTEAPEVPRQMAPAPKPQAATAKVDGWKFEDDKLTCHVYAAEKRKSKKGSDYLVVKHNGKVNDKDVAFCFEDKLFDALLRSKDRECVFFLDLGQYVNIVDVVRVGNQEYRNGQPYDEQAQPEAEPELVFAATDDDIPFQEDHCETLRHTDGIR